MNSDYRRVVHDINDAIQDYYTVYNKGAGKIDAYQLTVQQENVMLFIMRHERTTAHEIANAFAISKSAVSQVLSKLESRGFIVRESNPNNLRESFILLGAEGQQYAAWIDEADETFVRTLFSQIELADLKQMLQTLNKINRIMQESTTKR
ncbi:MarR family winged helix-turn-helix transcriptional regulator [Paenibacillus alvei]|uniref:MarR family winged helix-turn-helix transcriptional regulator n=1 Tax=Paenibacillus alvei TaxID=44250 RepID=A0ABT4GW10_PAEAL|nr:MarR family winged helix-turn-helix transcriptional regulator [Paenibacillus alvei]EJW15233.1 MarR family transcriptional regulator [Paenibacillus alvei DSM 29]MCY7484026.1 MarR family winged helix-turn-helix transcriptional regulator [Paenibacillus alvei]MCY9544278.1 MarR family winged helix-turn-helix transcriptional regulator [Paenibacillus alvei]MCY9702886.1 MarR family winged helix-turn-helix transcriptional regulator [Paenibacillus alvei]MCY9733201.1 MarR family winged helix-turn-heli